jgi:hypothetical protein
MPDLPLWSSPPPEKWGATLRAELKVLHFTILRVGLLASGMDCSPEEQSRLALLSHQYPEGITAAELEALDIQMQLLTQDVAFSPEERFRLELLAQLAHQYSALHEFEGPSPANMQDLDALLRLLVRDVAVFAQAAVSRAAAAPDDPRRHG